MSTNSIKMDIHFKIMIHKLYAKEREKKLLLPFVKIIIK
jgi:hypothetical protein